MVPTPRTEVTVANETVLNLITGSLQRVEESIGRLSTEMRIELAKLPEVYLGRREGDRRFDEMSARISVETAARERTMRDMTSSVEKLETRLTEGRRWFVTLACASAVGTAALIVNLIGQLT
jgi:hypothetical protein